MYYITINVQYVRYSTGRKIKYFIVLSFIVNFFPTWTSDPGSKLFMDPVSGSASKTLSILTQKIVSKLSESGMIIPDPGLDCLPIPDYGV